MFQKKNPPNRVLLTDVLSFFQHKLFSAIEERAKSHSWPWIVVIVAVCISFFFSKPSYTLLTENLITSPYGNALTWWLQHPFSSVPVEKFFDAKDLVDGGHYFGCASHCDKLTFRAFIPILHWIFPFGLWLILISSHIAGVAIFFFAYKFLNTESEDTVVATLGTWALASSFAGAWAFHDFICGDAVAIAFLLAALIERKTIVCALFVVCASLTDERAFIATPFLAGFKFWKEYLNHPRASISLPEIIYSQSLKPFYLGGVFYMLLRCYFVFFYQQNIGSTMLGNIDIIRQRIYTDYPYNIFPVFELLWIFPIFFLLYQIYLKKFLAIPTILYLSSFIGIIATSFIVLDLERSLYYLLPGILISIACLNVSALRQLMGFCFVGNILIFQPGHSLLVIIGSLISNIIK
jgi:hypothetical protein